jgi:DNA-binding MarR family transcriptional regulator
MARHPSDHETAQQMGRECIAVRVRLINRVISALYDEALRPFGLRISQANILVAVANMPEARPAHVARILRIEKSTLSRDLDLLKRNGWLQSDPPTGGPNQTVGLTREGKRLLTRIKPSWERAQAKAKLLLGDDGAAALLELTGKLGFGKPASGDS